MTTSEFLFGILVGSWLGFAIVIVWNIRRFLTSLERIANALETSKWGNEK